MDELSRFERVDAAINLKEADRVPADPLNIYIHGYQGGISFKEFMEDPVKATRAAEIARKEKIGEGDQIYPSLAIMDHLTFPMKATWDQYTLRWEIFDEFPPKGNIPNFYEKETIKDYDDIMERGFSTILFDKEISKKTLKKPIDEILYYTFEFPKIHAREWRKLAERNHVPLMVGGRACIPLDILQYYRGFTGLVRDIHEQPDKVKEMCEWLLEYEIIAGLRQATIMGAGEVPGAEKILWFNGGPPGMTPQIFEEFFWPFAKKGIDMIVKRGFKAHCHWDNDLTPHLERMTDIAKGLPKGKIILDLEKTNMAKAKEILGDKVCLYGNVPSSVLVHGTVNDVKKYCKKLIANCAEGGGFILATECETPWDAKPENVRAIIASAKEYGKYK